MERERSGRKSYEFLHKVKTIAIPMQYRQVRARSGVIVVNLWLLRLFFLFVIDRILVLVCVLVLVHVLVAAAVLALAVAVAIAGLVASAIATAAGATPLILWLCMKLFLVLSLPIVLIYDLSPSSSCFLSSRLLHVC